MAYEIKETRRYRKAYKRARQKIGFKRDKLEAVIELLSRDQPLPSTCEDHELSGELDGTRECHVQPDMLLVYRKIDNILVLLLVNIGSHHELFGN